MNKNKGCCKTMVSESLAKQIKEHLGCLPDCYEINLFKPSPEINGGTMAKENKQDCYAFKNRGLTRMPDAEMNRIRDNGLLSCDAKDVSLANDWVMVIRESADDTKYGRMMYSKTIDRLRDLTMGEFYGTGVVD